MRDPLEPFQKVVLATLISVVTLILVGAMVRATGAGLGCPDWPTCWGRLIPPISVDQVDFGRLDLDLFKRKAERYGFDPDRVSEQTLRAQFDPVHVWTEYVNRLTSLPVGIFALLTACCGWRQARRKRWSVFICGIAALSIVLINAWLGRLVVLSGLKPGIITLHMALAMLLVGLLVYAAWRGCEQPWRLPLAGGARWPLRAAIVALLVLTVFEGLMGSQVREMTDQLAKEHVDLPRSSWTAELEDTWMYLIHRSFSWAVLGAALAFYFMAGERLLGGCRWLEKSILGMVLGQMVLGLVLSHISVLALAQVLHIGLSALLIAALFLWVLGAFAGEGTLPVDLQQEGKAQ